eukprot:gnl/Chilomastix_cuspidata/1080.p1 GENE.gnl/Chilomastix_cuspidata/1080~~gnl/Chilomastix_cuspidata/1080.p1  ORF type:complete len:315 (+),score=124.98 gnl/Chilomastix_cuspidata/1080:162-1106(+)
MSDADAVQKFIERRWKETPESSQAVIAIETLLYILQNSKFLTVMELEAKIREVSKLVKLSLDEPSVISATDLFSQFIVHEISIISQSEDISKSSVMVAKKFLKQARDARQIISKKAIDFISEGSVVLVHGYSRTVMACLEHAASRGRHFSVLFTRGGPIIDNTAVRTLQKLSIANIPAKLIPDASVAFYMQKVSLVMTGAESVVESGGVINRIGTYQIAHIAHAFSKPFYVAVESFKFSRFFPLGQGEVPQRPAQYYRPPGISEEIPMVEARSDYTPPELITLLFTNLGVLTTAAVSDELIKLHEYVRIIRPRS